jgi:ankyrin repeat protein
MTCHYTTTTTMKTSVSLKRKRSGDISPRKIADSINTSLPPRKVIRVLPTLAKKSNKTTQNPQQSLQSIASERGLSSECHSYQQVERFFETMPMDLDAWNFEVLAAVRNGDVNQLRAFHQEGRNLKCSNKFGETLMHVACRKTLVSVVDFLIHEVGMPVNIHDDTGRTPLHDAFWTPEPNEELIDLMLSHCPDLLFVQDKRGHCPLQYSRQSHWDTWNTYLQSRKEQLVFATLNSASQ